MVKVLQNWIEIGEANKFLSKKGLPRYSTAEKNWDLRQLYSIIESIPRHSTIIDLGCSGLIPLKLLHAMGFENLYGIDLSLSWKNRLSQVIRMWRNRSLRAPFYLYKGDLTKTEFPAQTFDLAICISVIEHGVDLKDFLAESHRILKPSGSLFITTDYWEKGVQANNDNNPFGLPWKIFSKEKIEQFIRLSYDFGFSPYGDLSIPACSDKCVTWNNQEYSFLCMAFKKVRA